LVGFFAINEKPTGSKDPFALRRATLAVNALSSGNALRFSFKKAVKAQPIIGSDTNSFAIFERLYGHGFEERTDVGASAALDNENIEALVDEVLSFVVDRLKVQQREAGVRHDLIDAVFALGGEDDLVRLLARVKALQAFVETADGTNLLAGYKRAANILKAAEKDGIGEPAAGTGEGAEAALAAALDVALPNAKAAISNELFTDAMAALATLRAPVDAFFEAVMVNDPDPAIRSRRLALLARFRDAVHGVADFSKIEG
jgi:glycyl-tRNA synthetase beta chain